MGGGEGHAAGEGEGTEIQGLWVMLLLGWVMKYRAMVWFGLVWFGKVRFRKT